MNPSPEWSEIEVADVQRASRLITCKNIQPLKILNPRSPSQSCHVVLSSYGGGMVSGDSIKIKITCRAGATLFLGSQSNTKIFKSVNGAEAEHRTVGTVEEKALVVVFPDPVVLQENSRYRQVQEWEVRPQGLLLVFDWFHSGRMDTGEKFRFDFFHSELRVTQEGKVVLLDRFAFRPDTHIPSSPANFGRFQTMFSGFLVGSPDDARFHRLAEILLGLKREKTSSLNPDLLAQERLVSVVKVKEGVYVLRAAAKSRLDLQPLCEAIAEQLGDGTFLGLNPLKRKF